MSTTTIPVAHHGSDDWKLPYHGTIGMISLIVAETAIFTIFVVAYVFYIGKSLNGPYPRQVLELPIFNTVCLLSSSFTIWLAERGLKKGAMSVFNLWWAISFLLGAIFLFGTGLEWRKLIYHDGLTIRTNLFGTTFYSLVGLHASHVIVGLTMLLIVFIFGVLGKIKSDHIHQIETLSLYWHFVDAVWVVVFTVVYVIGR
jgi:cytochrome c oxidase subunit III